MGLDMYAYTTDRVVDAEVDFEASPADDLHYWRKHPNLHGWMERLYRRKGGGAARFNCTTVALDSHDLDRLETDIRAKCLPDTTGYFFGDSDGSEIEDDLAFIAEAREALAAGKTVFYYSWW